MKALTSKELKDWSYLHRYDDKGNVLEVWIMHGTRIVHRVANSDYDLQTYFDDNNIQIDKDCERRIKILRLALIYDFEFSSIYTMTAPYTHEYCVSSPYVKDGYCRAVTARRNWFEQLPENLYSYMADHHPDYDYESLLTRLKEYIKQGKFKKVSGMTFRGQPTSDEKLQTIKDYLRTNRRSTDRYPTYSDIYEKFVELKHELNVE